MPHIKTGVGVVIENDNKILLGHRVSDYLDTGGIYEPDSWTLPGGKQEYEETTVDACIREVKEETGLDVSRAKGGYQFCYHRDNKGQNYIVDIYRFDMDAMEEDLTLQKEETMDGKFATLDEIRSIAKEGKFLHFDSIKKVFEE